MKPFDPYQSIHQYRDTDSLADAHTPPSAWYNQPALHHLEQQTVFHHQWLLVARADEIANDGDYVALQVAGQPIIIVNSNHKIRAFYNICRHHGAILKGNGKEATTGSCKKLVCPYHGWTYNLEGQLVGLREFAGVNNFNQADNGLVEIQCKQYWHWLFVCFDNDAPPLFNADSAVEQRLDQLNMLDCQYYQSRKYQLQCNWKVYVDNYLDGGFHVPVLHRGLSTALDNSRYRIEIVDKTCWQSCPTKPSSGDIGQVRKGTANYVWIYPNLMFNCYQGVCGVMRVFPITQDSCEVVFDYYFADDIDAKFRANSVAVADSVQQEDADICESVQIGLNSRGYETGRLSVSKEAGEHLFHRLLYQDLIRGC